MGGGQHQTTSSQLIREAMEPRPRKTSESEQWHPHACSYRRTTSGTPLHVTHLLGFQRSPFCHTCGSHTGQQDTTHHLHAELPQSGKPRGLIHQPGELCGTTLRQHPVSLTDSETTDSRTGREASGTEAPLLSYSPPPPLPPSLFPSFPPTPSPLPLWRSSSGSQ